MRARARCIAAVCFILFSLGCARGMRVPAEFTAGIDPARHNTLFTPIQNIQISGSALIGGTSFSDIKRSNFTFFATQPDQSRLFLSSNSKGALLDIIRRGSILTVVAEQTGFIYQGEIDPQKSPFTKTWGFEPGDIYHVLTIGQTIAADRTGSEGIVEFKSSHSLPERVRWRRGEQEFVATYLSWEYVANTGAPESTEKRLIPTKFQIVTPATGVFMTLTVRSATFDQPVQESIFTPALNYKARHATLGNLESALAPR